MQARNYGGLQILEVVEMMKNVTQMESSCILSTTLGHSVPRDGELLVL